MLHAVITPPPKGQDWRIPFHRFMTECDYVFRQPLSRAVPGSVDDARGLPGCMRGGKVHLRSEPGAT